MRGSCLAADTLEERVFVGALPSRNTRILASHKMLRETDRNFVNLGVWLVSEGHSGRRIPSCFIR
jgi:hypothetical protein